jgi:AraC-like DNA-binding protein
LKSSSSVAFFSTQVTDARRFYLELTPDTSRGISVVSGGVERCEPHYSIDRPTFPYFGIEYVVRGTGRVSIGGSTSQIRPGNLLSYGPDVPHTIVTDSKDPFVKYFVDLAGDDARTLMRQCGIAPGSVAQVFPPDTLAALFEELVTCGIGGRRGSPSLCAKLVECLLLKARSMKAPSDARETNAFNKFQHYRNYVQENFLRLRTLEQIAEECRVSGTYLCHLFRRFDAQTPYRHLMRLKMSYAAEQIQKGALVKQAAHMVGFSDQFHFSRVFRNTLGLSPEKWRSMQHGHRSED